MSISDNLLAIKNRLPASCKLVAVTKTQPVEAIQEAYRAPHRLFGENKAQELLTKADALPADIEWHMIGHLQTNKVKALAPVVSLIHGVDSLRLLEEINKQAAKNLRVIKCLLQVHIAAEETKFGFAEDEVLDLIAGGRIGEHVRVEGLMGMATFTDNKDQVHSEFKRLRTLFEKIKSLPLPPSVAMRELSMGMSGDYEIAVEEGSTMVRIGTAIFGERPRQETH